MRRLIFFLLAASLLCSAHFGPKDYLQPEAAGVREHDIDVNISQVYYQPDEPVWLYDPDRFNFTVTEDGTNAYDLTGKEIYFAAKKYLGDTSFIFYIPCTVDGATGGLCHADLAVNSLTTAGLYWAGIRITDTTNILVTAWIGKLKALGVISDSPPWAPPQAYTKSESDARYGQKIPGHSNLWQSGFDDFRTSDVRIAEPTETNQPTTMAYVLGEIGALDTDDIPEGSSNFYYTEARDNANFTSNWNTKTTTHLPEGDNLYWTSTRFSSAFGDMTTADLTESNNLYWTQARFDSAFSGKDTDGLSEGTNNLYYTETRGSNTFENVWPTKDLDDLPDGPTYMRVTPAEKANYDEAYTLATNAFPYTDDAYIIVERGTNDVVNGTALKSAYTAAKALTPGGNALSATNRACLIIPAGRYDLGSVAWDIDGEFVDVRGEGVCRWNDIDGDDKVEDGEITFPDTHIICDTDTEVILVTARDVHMCGLHIEQETDNFSNGGLCVDNVNGCDRSQFIDIGITMPISYRKAVAVGTNTTVGGYWGRCYTTSVILLESTIFATMEHCAAGGDFSFGGWSTVSGIFTDCTGGVDSFACSGTASGTFLRCTGGAHSFGNCETASGTFTDCAGGAGSFGTVTASGTFIRCTGLEDSFGGCGVASGTFIDCIGGNSSFGINSSGTNAVMRRCISIGRQLPIRNWQGLMENCHIEVTGSDKNAVEVTGPAKLFGNTLIANGTGKSIYTASPQTITIGGNELNKGISENSTLIIYDDCKYHFYDGDGSDETVHGALMGRYTEAEANALLAGKAGTTDIVEVSTEGLVLSMNFNSEDKIGLAGSETIFDSSTYNNHGTNSGATFSATGGFNSSGCFTFNGTDNYVNCGSDSSLDVDTNSFSACAWIKTTSANIGHYAISVLVPVLTPYGWGFGIKSNAGKISGYVRATSGSGVETEGTTTINDGNWHFIVLVADRITNELKIYVNGVCEDTDDISGESDLTGGNLYIGEMAHSDGLGDFYPWDGSIDDVRVYNRALSADEISQLCEQRAETRNCYVSQKDIYVDSDGKVGIGTTSPNEKLCVVGNVVVGDATVGTDGTRVIMLTNGTIPTSSPADAIQFYAEDVAGSSELKVRNEKGEKTILTRTITKQSCSVPIPLSYFVESTAGSGTNNSCQVSYEVNANKQVEIRGRSYETNALHTAYCYSVPMTIGEYPLMPNFSSWQTNAFSYIISTDSTNVADNLINIAICYETNQVDLATNIVSTTAGVDLTGNIGTNDVINALGDGDTFWWRVEFQSKNTNDVYLVELKNNYEE